MIKLFKNMFPECLAGQNKSVLSKQGKINEL